MSKLKRIIIIIVIASCAILSVHLFLFPFIPYIEAETGSLKTAAEFESILCSNSNWKRRRIWEEQKCPRHGFVTVKPGARLGNKMWEYISVWAIAKRADIDAYVPECLRRELDQTFDSLTVPTFENISHCLVNTNGFAKSLDEWNYSYQGIMMNPFQAGIVMTWADEVRKQFTFKKELVDKSEDILRKLVNSATNKTFVGVHIRRSDYVGFYLKGKYNIEPANASFYYTAMKYFEKKYHNVIFIIASDDVRWCDEQFRNKSNAVVVGKHFQNSPSLDLAVLAACNHSIVDYGSYSGWAAFLAGGETIYYEIEGDINKRLAKMLPNWRGYKWA